MTKRSPLCSRATPLELPFCSLFLLHAPRLLPELASRRPSSPIIAPLERLTAMSIRQLYTKVPFGVPSGILDRPRLAPSPQALNGPHDLQRSLAARLALPGMGPRLQNPPPRSLLLSQLSTSSPTSTRRPAHPRFFLSSHALSLALPLHASNSFGCTLWRQKQLAKLSFGGLERRALRRTGTELMVQRSKSTCRMERRKDTSMQRICGNCMSRDPGPPQVLTQRFSSDRLACAVR